MKIIYPNLNIFDIRSDSRDITKEHCSYISIVIPLKKRMVGQKVAKTAWRIL